MSNKNMKSQTDKFDIADGESVFRALDRNAAIREAADEFRAGEEEEGRLQYTLRLADNRVIIIQSSHYDDKEEARKVGGFMSMSPQAHGEIFIQCGHKVKEGDFVKCVKNAVIASQSMLDEHDVVFF